MKRREMLLGFGVAAVGALAGDSFAMQHEHHAQANQVLTNTASKCVLEGQICLNHIHQVLAQGDSTLGTCATRVSELIAACTALQAFAAQNSIFVPKYAQLTAEVCKSTEAECRKFETKHAECKTCADSCAACIAACAKVV